MSLRISSRLSPALWIASTKRRCSLSRLVSSKVVARPSTAFMGVRISWLIMAKKVDLAAFAVSAA